MAKKMVMIIAPLSGVIIPVTEKCARRCLAKGYTKVEDKNKEPCGNAPEGKNAGQVSAGEPGKEEKTKDNPKAIRPKKMEVK